MHASQYNELRYYIDYADFENNNLEQFMPNNYNWFSDLQKNYFSLLYRITLENLNKKTVFLPIYTNMDYIIFQKPDEFCENIPKIWNQHTILHLLEIICCSITKKSFDFF